MVGLLELLVKQREIILSDIKESRSQPPRQEKCLKTLAESDTSWDTMQEYKPVTSYSVEDYHAPLEDNLLAEETLIASQLRRLRNFYVVLMEVCQRDEMLLAW